MGTTGLTVHTVRVDPRTSDRVYISSSGGGLYRSDDRGDSWSILQQGVLQTCPIGGRSDAPDIPKKARAAKLAEHLGQVHTCTHKIAISNKNPDHLFQQNHCGVFESRNHGGSWRDVSPDDDDRHGFSVGLTENGSTSLFVVPAYQGICKRHNSCVKGQLSAYRRDRSGWRKLSKGLPGRVHTCVLRDAMATDPEDPGGVYIGTTTGEVFGSVDGGDSWFGVLEGAGRIQGVTAFSA